MSDAMSEGNVQGKVRGVIARIAKIDPAFDSAADVYRQLGVKSASALDLLLSLEEEFGISISDDAFNNARTTEDIVVLISALKGEAA